LKANNFQSPTNALDAPFQKAWKTEEHAFIWVQKQPVFLQNFMNHIPITNSPQPWTAFVPLVSKLKEADRTAPLFVDVGGGPGFQCAAFKLATQDHYQGRIILQDLPQTLDRAPSHDGVDKMAQNFFEEQQIKGLPRPLLDMQLTNFRCCILLHA
jgi:demethylsterigmatocystin 6-O-methyltransferase